MLLLAPSGVSSWRLVGAAWFDGGRPPSAAQIGAAAGQVSRRQAALGAVQKKLSAANAQLTALQTQAEVLANRYDQALVNEQQALSAYQVTQGRLSGAERAERVSRQQVGNFAAEEFESGGDLRDSVLKILNVLPRSHPFTTVRAAELKKWAESRDYQRIMDGHYPRRSEDKDTSVTDSFRESAASYASNVKNSKDPLMKLVSDFAGGAGDLGGRVRRGFGGFASSTPQDGPPSDSANGTEQPPTDDTPPRD